MRRIILVSGLLVLACVSARAGEPKLQGEWKTSLGIVTFKSEGDRMVATFTHPQIPLVKGSVTGKTATLKSEDKQRPGEAKLTLDDSGRSFSGTFQFGNNRPNPWKGWRPDPEATKGETSRFDGLWLTTTGLMELDQAGDKVHGRYGAAGYQQDRRRCPRPSARFPLSMVPTRQGLVRPEQGWQDASRAPLSAMGCLSGTSGKAVAPGVPAARAARRG